MYEGVQAASEELLDELKVLSRKIRWERDVASLLETGSALAAVSLCSLWLLYGSGAQAEEGDHWTIKWMFRGAAAGGVYVYSGRSGTTEPYTRSLEKLVHIEKTRKNVADLLKELELKNYR